MAMNVKRVLILVAILVAGYFVLDQISYIADPGLRDLHIRMAIKKLTKEQCAEILEGCERLYRQNIESVTKEGFVVSTDIPKPAADVGYREARIESDSVRFFAGGGGFSQVGYILIVCQFNPVSHETRYLYLDDGRYYSPRTQAFTDDP
jgi:hypothetical protein